jgi:hypothetical protein
MVALSRAPGWEPDSWGYHGDDGNSFASQNVGKHYGPSFTTCDTIGCGVNFRTGCAFFTKNGVNLGKHKPSPHSSRRWWKKPSLSCSHIPLPTGTAFREVKGKLYPTVGLKKTGEHIRVNFGQTPFVYDIDSMMDASTLISDSGVHLFPGGSLLSILSYYPRYPLSFVTGPSNPMDNASREVGLAHHWVGDMLSSSIPSFDLFSKRFLLSSSY